MFVWDLTSGEVKASTKESQVTLLSILFAVACKAVSICVVLWVACKVGIALSLVCLVREGRPVCWVCSLLNFSFCQLSPRPQAKDTGLRCEVR